MMSFCPEGLALNECMNELADGKVAALGGGHNFVCEVLVGEAKRTALGRPFGFTDEDLANEL